MTLANTPYMNLAKPEPGVTLDLVWAQMLNTLIDIIDAHDHSSGNGKSIPSTALSIGADVEFNSHYASELTGAKFDDQSATLASSILRCLYVKSGNLYYNNGSGAAVQLTSGSAIVSAISGAFSAYTPSAYPYSITSGDAQRILLVNTSSAKTLALPAATTSVFFIVKDLTGSAFTNNITLDPNGTDTIDGVAANKLLNINYGWTLVISDGISAWYTITIDPDPNPVGAITMFGGSSAPANWLFCDGSAISRTTYSRLWAIIGTTFGSGNGSTTFNVPDMRQKFPLGKAASGTGSTLGGTGGSIDHTHTVPAHYHALGTGADLAITSSGSHLHTIDHDHGSVTSASGGSHSHYMVYDTLSSSAISTSPGLARSYDGGNDYSYDLKLANTEPDKIATSTASSHTHSVDLPNYTGNSGSSSHTHSSGDFTGRIGLVTGGADGNSAMTSGSNNPPFVSLNFIIKF